MRVAFAMVVLAVAALAVRPLVLPLAAEIWTAAPMVADRGDDAHQGVLPSKTVLRLASKLRGDDPFPDSPPLALAAAEASAPSIPQVSLGVTADIRAFPKTSRPRDHQPRGPPLLASPPNAAASRSPDGAFG
jgi:hypothetical protein